MISTPRVKIYGMIFGGNRPPAEWLLVEDNVFAYYNHPRNSVTVQSVCRRDHLADLWHIYAPLPVPRIDSKLEYRVTETTPRGTTFALEGARHSRFVGWGDGAKDGHPMWAVMTDETADLIVVSSIDTTVDAQSGIVMPQAYWRARLSEAVLVVERGAIGSFRVMDAAQQLCIPVASNFTLRDLRRTDQPTYKGMGKLPPDVKRVLCPTAAADAIGAGGSRIVFVVCASSVMIALSSLLWLFRRGGGEGGL